VFLDEGAHFVADLLDVAFLDELPDLI